MDRARFPLRRYSSRRGLISTRYEYRSRRDVTGRAQAIVLNMWPETENLWLQPVYGAVEKVIRKSSRGQALGVEALSDKPRRTAQRSPGVVSLVRWAKPPAADGRSQGKLGAKAGLGQDPGIMKRAGAFEEGGSSISVSSWLLTDCPPSLHPRFGRMA